MERSLRTPDAEFLSVEETAKFLGVSVKTFRRLLKKKLLPPPRRITERVFKYPWDVVVAMGVLMRDGFLPLPERENSG